MCLIVADMSRLLQEDRVQDEPGGSWQWVLPEELGGAARQPARKVLTNTKSDGLGGHQQKALLASFLCT